jgi:hypothetical protein
MRISQFLCASIVLGISLLSVSQADEQKPALEPSSWGHVRGQVVLEGKRDDPRLQKYFEDLPLTQPLALKVPVGAEPEFVSQIPNEQLIVDGKTQGIKNALVYLRNRPQSIHPDYVKIPPSAKELTMLHRQFTPRVFTLQVGQTLVMTSDQVVGEPTNFHAELHRNQNFNVLVPLQGPAFRWIPKQAETLPRLIRSSIYPTAKSYFIIQDHPYLAVTDAKGEFELKNLPRGKHELTIWHETVGYVAKNLVVEVKPNETQMIPTQPITVEQLAK